LSRYLTKESVWWIPAILVANIDLQKNADAYGFNIIHDCGDYGWGPQKYVKSEYDTEHILEWSTVRL